jgi:ribonuclease P protein component
MSHLIDQRFPRSLRIRRQADFDRIYEQSVVAADSVLVVRGCRNGLATPRLGLTVSRKVGKAVVRNRWKRLIREAFRRSRGELPDGLDLVVRPSRDAEPDYGPIAESLVKLARQLDRRLTRRKS